MSSESRIEVTKRINAPVEMVSRLLENLPRTPEWNPLVRRVIPRKGKGVGVGSTLEWEAVVAGVPIRGTSETIAWSPGRKYSWRNRGQVKGLTDKRLLSSVDGTFLLKPVGDTTELTAVVTFNVSRYVRPLIDSKAVRLVLERGVEQALKNIGRITRGR